MQVLVPYNKVTKLFEAMPGFGKYIITSYNCKHWAYEFCAKLSGKKPPKITESGDSPMHFSIKPMVYHALNPLTYVNLVLG
jgi:hypothetical protein